MREGGDKSPSAQAAWAFALFRFWPLAIDGLALSVVSGRSCEAAQNLF